eukprot:scaffold184388_cov15-Tisochrysis_lutea.AAC.1
MCLRKNFKGVFTLPSKEKGRGAQESRSTCGGGGCSLRQCRQCAVPCKQNKQKSRAYWALGIKSLLQWKVPHVRTPNREPAVEECFAGQGQEEPKPSQGAMASGAVREHAAGAPG